MLRLRQFRVQNFRNIDDSGWVPVERVTAFVGRNESGKTALLKALHKFNPATPEAYSPQREFPRDRFTRDCEDPADWPVCSGQFEIPNELRSEIADLLGGDESPEEVICTRFFDGSLVIEYSPAINESKLSNAPVLAALDSFAAGARRMEAPNPDQEEATAEQRRSLAEWATDWKQRLKDVVDLRDADGANLLSKLRSDTESRSNPQSAEMVEALQESIEPIIEEANEAPVVDRIDEIIEENLPLMIYFENYGILDSAIYLPRFLEDLKRAPDDSRIRTINAMFKHVRLTAHEIEELGRERAQQARAQNEEPTSEMIVGDQESKEARAIKLNSASIDITDRFNRWYGQRRHSIEYQADGDYFRIWVADDRRPDVKIELESRSKGFQWFFSFYLMFLVESAEGHKNAVLLLDEPGLHLHPTAQQELIGFFERLSERNQLLYSTHSPFLIDGEHIHRVRPVTEDNTGHSRIAPHGWPADRETIFPLQAAAGYAMVRGLFQHRDNVLVEGMSDYYYLTALSTLCRQSGREALPDEIYITPCGGTKLVGHLASLFLGQQVRPLILLDGDEAGRARQNALLKELYVAHKDSVLMLDSVLGQPGTETEIEDILSEEILLPILKPIVGKPIKLSAADRKAGSLPSQVKAWSERRNINLPQGWKASAAIGLVSQWAERPIKLPDEVLNRASSLFAAITERFGPAEGGQG